MTSITSVKLLTNVEAAAMLGLQPTTLEIWRTRGKGPKFVKLGFSKQAPIRYNQDEILSWLETQCFNNTSAYPDSQNLGAAPSSNGVRP